MVLVSYKLLKEYGSIKTIVWVFELAVVRRLLHAGLGDILPLRGEPHAQVEFITALFYEVDEQLRAIPKHPEAHLWPSEVVTLGLVELSRRVTPLDWSPKPCRSIYRCL